MVDPNADSRACCARAQNAPAIPDLLPSFWTIFFRHPRPDSERMLTSASPNDATAYGARHILHTYGFLQEAEVCYRVLFGSRPRPLGGSITSPRSRATADTATRFRHASQGAPVAPTMSGKITARELPACFR